MIGYNAALEVRRREIMPAEWAMTQMERAGALARLGDLAGDPASLQGAVAGYDAFECFSGESKAGVHGVELHVGRLSDLGCGHLFEFGKDEHFALLVG